MNKPILEKSSRGGGKDLHTRKLALSLVSHTLALAAETENREEIHELNYGMRRRDREEESGEGRANWGSVKTVPGSRFSCNRQVFL